MTAKQNPAADAAEQILAEEAAKVPTQKGETKVTVEEHDGKTTITVEDADNVSLLDKVKTAAKNRKVLGTAAAVLTIAAYAVLKTRATKSDVEDDEPATEPNA